MSRYGHWTVTNWRSLKQGLGLLDREERRELRVRLKDVEDELVTRYGKGRVDGRQGLPLMGRKGQ